VKVALPEGMYSRHVLRAVGVGALLVAVIGCGAFAAHLSQQHSAFRSKALHELEASALSSEFRSRPVGGQRKQHQSLSQGPDHSGSSLSTAQEESLTLPIGPVLLNPSTGGTSVGSTVPTIPAGPSSTTSSGGTAPTAVSVAILTPLLSTFQFGGTVGFLLVCNTGAGSLSAAASQVPGLSQVLAPVVAQISPDCSELSAQAVAGLNKLNSELGVLQGLTPATEPYFNELNLVFANLNQLAPQFEPLTGTITDLGPLVDFFSGEPQGS
jgi:hypothetical protein